MKIRSIACLFLLSLFISCKKEEDKSAPHISSGNPFDVTHNSVKVNCSGIDNGPIIEKGLCWSDSKTPDIHDNKVIVGDGEANFEGTITGLEPSHAYYIRAYASNKYRAGYGPILGVITASVPEAPTVERLNAYDITKTSALLKGFIQRFGQAPLDSFGVCWSTHPDPTKEDQMKLVPLTNGVPNFNTFIYDLEPNTLYYIRSFTATDYGTFYSTNNTLLKTYYGTVTDYDGNTYNTVKIGDQEWMAENLIVTHFNDGTTIDNLFDENSWYNATKPGYCEFSPASTYGIAYNWYCAYNGRNIAPVGWHVPNFNDWQTLLSSGGGPYKEAAFRIQGNEFWNSPNQATNENGFSAIGSGIRYQSGYFYYKFSYAYFWVNSLSPTSFPISAGSYITSEPVSSPLFGLSIRCVKD